MNFNNFNNNDYAKKILNDMFGGGDEPKAEKKVDMEEVAKPLFDMFNSFVKAGFTEDQAIDLVKFIIVSAFKMNR